MNIGVDIDGVLIDRETYQFTKGAEYGKKWGLGKIINPNAYDINEIFGWSKDQFSEFWREHLWDYSENSLPMKDADIYLQKLKSDGHKIIINTSRWLSERDDAQGEKMRQVVRDWFKKHRLVYDEIFFACGDKVAGVKKYSLDCHIEDNVPEALQVAEHTPVVLFHAGHNKGCNAKNILRANDWQHTYNNIGQIGLKKLSGTQSPKSRDIN